MTPISATVAAKLLLRSLNLVGFKTFARPTEIRFEGGVTAIVGPNGSGKTNIVDALRWVLGSSQVRDLRGRKMEEVIYAGGERRPRASFAEVTLLFDNPSGRFPVDYHEVAIKRRVERDGESDYFLNGARVRRRDLIHLLASTGLTVDSYAIIDQHDIESIVVCSPSDRRALLEEAAQMRGVKARRQEAGQRLTELANNLLRLEDIASEIEPRLETVRAQAAAAREAAEASARLELLKGSIVWEEWREARDAHRRATSQVQTLERRLVEAREHAQSAEAEFAGARAEMEAAQEGRLARQRRLGELRLEVSAAEHAVQLANERAANQGALAEAALREEGDHSTRTSAAEALRDQLVGDLDKARRSFETVPALPSPPAVVDAALVQEARRAAERSRRAAAVAASSVAALRTRREFLDEQAFRLKAVAAAADKLPAAEAALAYEQAIADASAGAAAEAGKLRSELEGLDALRPSPGPGLLRLRDVLTPEPGYEAALAAALGSMADALVARDERQALSAVAPQQPQRTVLYPASRPEIKPGSLLEHVKCRPGYELVAGRLLGHLVLGEDVTMQGVYREPGLVRAGFDPRLHIDARRQRLTERIAALESSIGDGDGREAVARAAAKLAELRLIAAGASGLEETHRLREEARIEEGKEQDRLRDLERRAAGADEHAAEAASELDRHLAAVSEYRTAARQQENDRVRWRDRIDDLIRQLSVVEDDLANLRHAAAALAARVSGAGDAAAAARAALPALQSAAEGASARLAEAEGESPAEEAEMAESSRHLVALEETRVDARLKVGTLDGNLEMVGRESELLQARMEEIRSRMPDGMAPEDVPGGKAREREIRTLERRLDEIGPTNALAEAECRELEARFETLRAQLADIAAARSDLEQLITKLREEEESRYEAVFGAVAANFHEYFAQLAPGGRATLRHADGDEGPRSGVEILVQPPRKRLQNVTLLSSGERSMAALALVLALDEVNPSPFTVLDEVDAALDDANVGRFGEMVARLGTQRQFLVITHNHVTMAHASTLYGIHLDESGSSHLVSVRLEDIRKPATRSATTAQAG